VLEEENESALGDAWAADRSPGTVMPPPPNPVSAAALGPGPQIGATPLERPTGPRGWRKFFAIVGIVLAFPFLLTIPGWIALSAYRKWKAGERQQPTGLIVWGVVATLLFSYVFATAALGDFSPSTASTPPVATAPAVVVPPPTFELPLPADTFFPPDEGTCGHEVNGRVRYVPGECGPDDELVVIKTVLEGEYQNSLALARRNCPLETVLFTDHEVGVACWGPA
jgi:hypothetical protein